MPALTTIQLFDTHSKYLDASDQEKPEEFRHALNEVMPRIYKLGYWRELLVEHSQDASDGYISLPQDTDSIVAGLIDNNPVPTRSLWHDYKMFGTNDEDDTHLSAFIDDGYAPTYRDLDTASKYDFRVVALKAPFTFSVPYKGVFTYRYRKYTDASTSSALVSPNTVLKGSSYNETIHNLETEAEPPSGEGENTFFSINQNANEVLSITWRDLKPDFPVRIIGRYRGDASSSSSTLDSTKDVQLVDIDTINGSSLYRRFRIGNTSSDSTAHMLLKRRWVDCDSNTDIVNVPSNAILKHALLGKLAEDNADLQRAQYHWGTVNQLLEADTDSYRGAAKPTLHIAPDGVGAGMTGMY